MSLVPSALAVTHLDALTIAELYERITESEVKIGFLEASILNKQMGIDQRNVEITESQTIIAVFDAIIASGGVLTDDQIESYDFHVGTIVRLLEEIVSFQDDIDDKNDSIVIHQSRIVRLQVEIDSR